jgi:hypothetical protein
MDAKIHDKPSDVANEGGVVVVRGPDDVAVSLTADAALETGRRLRVAGHNAREAAEALSHETSADKPGQSH